MHVTELEARVKQLERQQGDIHELQTENTALKQQVQECKNAIKALNNRLTEYQKSESERRQILARERTKQEQEQEEEKKKKGLPMWEGVAVQESKTTGLKITGSEEQVLTLLLPAQRPGRYLVRYSVELLSKGASTMNWVYYGLKLGSTRLLPHGSGTYVTQYTNSYPQVISQATLVTLKGTESDDNRTLRFVFTPTESYPSGIVNGVLEARQLSY